MKPEKSIALVDSTSFDPWFNLALEEFLLQRCKEQQVILYLWQNDQTVVIGRNQNAWKECRCQELESDGGKLARRLSGGGAVFHDLGNLNFTFIMDKTLYNLERQLEVILRAARSLGINALFSGRNDLTAEGKKFSGNAFYHGERVSYHHGTVLIDSDFDKLGRYLQVSKEKLQSKGVKSAPSRVINLKSLAPALTVAGMKSALRQGFGELYGEGGAVVPGEIEVWDQSVLQSDPASSLAGLYHKYASWEWRYGKSPRFDLTLEHRFTWGNLDLGLVLENGMITGAEIYSDAMDSLLIRQMAQALSGLPLKADVIGQKLSAVETRAESRPLLLEAGEWLSQKLVQL